MKKLYRVMNMLTGIFLIFSSISLMADIPEVAAEGDIFWVDVDNTSGPWNGTEEHPFQTIQDGINATTSEQGDIVRVQDGDYYETISIINKNKITIQGWSSFVCVRPPEAGSGPMCNIESDDVTVNFIHFHGNSTSENWDGIRVRDSVRVNIHECRTENFLDGIAITGCNETSITWGTTRYNTNSGIYVQNCENTVIEDYFIKDNDAEVGQQNGIVIYSSIRTKIHQCEITDNDLNGIYMSGSDDSENGTEGDWSISYNYIRNHYTGIYLVDSNDNDIIHNDIKDHTAMGVEIGSDINQCKIFYNNFEGNQEQAMEYIAQGKDDNGNEWDDSNNTGNYWEDRVQNEGFPDTYKLEETKNFWDAYPQSSSFDHTTGPQ